MTDSFEKAGQEAAAFQKIWLESFSKAAQAAFKFTPDAAPPEIVRQIRAGILQTLAESWDEFMRSPQFLDGMRQWMENAIAFRKLSNEFLSRTRHDLQAPSKTDIDTILSAISHVEKRLLDRLDELADQLANTQGSTGSPQTSPKQGRGRMRRKHSREKPRLTGR